jgi:CheY-like chemotaxis protein
MKSSELLKNIPVLVLTTSSSVEEKESCIRAGAAMYISKPTTMDGFNQIVTAISILAGII